MVKWVELADGTLSCWQTENEPGPSASVEAGRRSEEDEEEEAVFPGADFLSVADITQAADLSSSSDPTALPAGNTVVWQQQQQLLL